VADLSGKITQARKAGYTDAQILQYLGSDAALGSKVQTARKAGYKDADILGHLSGGKTAKSTYVPILTPVAGALANVNRGLGIGDEIAGGLAALPGAANALSRGDLKGVGDAFSEGMAGQRAIEDDFAAKAPRVAALARGTGNAVTLALPATKAVGVLQGANRVANGVRAGVAAATEAAAYGAADRGSVTDRLRDANAAATVAGVTGGVLGRGPKVVKNVGTAPNVLERSNVQTLKDYGVSLTPGQAMGGLAKNVEDVAQRAPILGSAIRGARARGGESLNRAFALDALSSVGASLPKNVKPGFQTIRHVADTLGKEYDRAADMVQQVARDAEFSTALADITRAADELPTDVRKQFDTILRNRLDSVLPDGAVVTGRRLREIQSDIGRIAAEKGASQDEAQRALGDLLEDVSDGLKETLGRYNPEAGKIIQQANEGWSKFVRLRRAAAAGKDGVATPNQLLQAVRAMDKSAGKGRVAQGKAVGQDLANAAAVVMPDAFGNPGTADAIGLGALGTLAVTNPAQGVATAAGLGAAATPYFLMGRKVVEQLPRNASKAELEAAARELASLVRKDPRVDPLLRSIVARLGVSVAVGQPTQNALAQ
jgi:hypothetical protein